jgi:adenine deaminase
VGEDGLLQAKTDNDLLPLAVVERHGKDAGVGTGFVHGLGLTRGAIGSTVGHDAHNLIIAGVDHESMQEVATQLRRVGGGIAAYDPKTETVETLSLPLAGLVTAAPLSEIKSHFIRVEDTAKELGLKPKSGMMTLSTLALEVIPELRMTNNGLVDVTRMEYADVIIE